MKFLLKGHGIKVMILQLNMWKPNEFLTHRSGETPNGDTMKEVRSAFSQLRVSQHMEYPICQVDLNQMLY